MSDEFYIKLAIARAWETQILTFPNPAVGCVVVDKFGKILSIYAHQKAGFAHAELGAVFLALCTISAPFEDDFLTKYNSKFSTKFSSAIECEGLLFEPNFLYEFILNNHANTLKSATAYVTLEPCAHEGKTRSCAKLLASLGFARVVIGADEPTNSAQGGAHILEQSGIKVKRGVCKDECTQLIWPFLKWQSGNFSFFKLALSANGVASGGVISNLDSRTLSHKLRSVSELLAIGGNTVRIDRPRLDTRLINDGKSPDILILSNRTDFDTTIPLFSIEGRNVAISSNLDAAFDGKLTMIEGAAGLLEAICERVDWFLIFHSSQFIARENLRIDLKLRPLFTSSLDSDSYSWYRLDK